ncbi:hypothetical protein JW835_10485 [bacterium]|nr:hypothetical protein [bacterium]
MVQHEIKTSLMSQAAAYLELVNGFMVPAMTLWKKLADDPAMEGISYDYFVEMLRKDSKFHVFDTDDEVMHELAKLISKKEMEDLGYYEGPRVMLKKSVPDEDDVADMLIEKADQTFESLRQAWALRPEDDPDTEDRLLKALAKAQRLQRELRVLFHKGSSKKEDKEIPSE